MGKLAEHIAASASKGTPVIATGDVRQRSYTGKDGTEKTVLELTVNNLGISLRRGAIDATMTLDVDSKQDGNSKGVQYDTVEPF